ncbi:hypothetical protein AVEN_260617-1, partial [Araneus ventricosus]
GTENTTWDKVLTALGSTTQPTFPTPVDRTISQPLAVIL